MSIFFLATPLLILSALPQTIKLIKTKKSADISILTYLLTVLGVLLIFIKALDENQIEIYFANGSSLLFLCINFFLILKYRNNKITK